MKSVINCAIVVSLTMWATCTWGDQPQGWDDSPMGMLYQAQELLKGERLGSGNRDKVKHDYGGAIALLNEIVIKTAGVVSNQAARAEALNLLAYCHLEGLGVEKDQMKAVSYFEESGKLGKCKALSDAAMCYALGVGVKKDEKKAFALIRQAVHDGENEREGSPDNFEIHMFKLAKDSRRNFTLAFEAKNNLGLCYLKGIGCEKDVERAKDVLGVQELKFASAAEGLAAAYCLSQLDNAKDPRVVDAILMEGVKEIVKLHTGDVNRFWGTCEWIRMFVVPCEEMLASMRSYGDGADMQLCVRKYAGDHVERDVEGAIAILGRIQAKCPDKALELAEHLSAMAAAGHPEDKVRLLGAFKKFAQKPDYGFSYWLGLGLCNGSDFFDVDLEEGRRMLTLAAEQGNMAAAQFDLGMRMEQGCFGEPDPVGGVTWLARAVDNGYVNACLNLGLTYVKGRGIEKDVIKGVSLIRRGAEAGDAMAQLTLGSYYQYGFNGIKVDTTEGFKWVNAAYTNGYDRAFYHMSRAYAFGLGVETNVFKAIDFALEAIDAGDERVKDFIGAIMPTDESPDVVKSVEIEKLKADAENGVARAQYLLARCFFYGMGVAKDESAALTWAERAACQNYADGANLISVYYFEKALKDGDYAESNKWGFRAIALGSLKAMLNYTRRYQFGKGVEVDEEMAVRLARVAGVCGLREAQFQYGLYLLGGIGVKRNLEEGERWIKIAAKNGCKEALDYLKGVDDVDGGEKDQKSSLEKSTSQFNPVEIKNEACAFRFEAIDGETELPREYMRTCENKEKLEKVRLPGYWILNGPVTRRQYAAVMELPLEKVMDEAFSEKDDPDAPIDNIDWLQAYEFCGRFNTMFAEWLPKGYLLQLPTITEWAHAVRIKERNAPIVSPVGCMLFTSDGRGGFLRTFNDKDMARLKHDAGEKIDVAVDYVRIPMRVRHVGVGLRPVLSPVVGGDWTGESRMVTRAVILTKSGRLEEAKRMVEVALEKGELDKEERERATDCLEYLNAEHENDFEEWSGMVTLVGAAASRRGYSVEPFVLGWMENEDLKNEDKTIAKAYEENGIEGLWMRICDLPEDVRSAQSIGEKRHMTVYVGEEIGTGYYGIATNTLVQVLRCDLDGDGRKDLVVEDFGSVGSGGYWYDFFRQKPDGTYTNVLSLQTVGLCAIPTTNGSSCAFIQIVKNSNPVLSASLVSYQDGEMLFTEITPRPFYMLDANEKQIYRSAPFIGAGYGLGWSHLQGRGIWYRPLYWPWKAGEVQGLKEVQEQAKNDIAERKSAKEELVRLKEKWPRAGERVSMWEMPRFAKRFHEIDFYQDNKWDKANLQSNAEFEKMIREAIQLRIEPSVWHYNLACILSLQGKKDEAFEALEQAIVAGENKRDLAQTDSDLDHIREDGRFKRLMTVMSVMDNQSPSSPKECVRPENGALLLTDSNSYFAFNEYAYLSIIDDPDFDQPLYLDTEGVKETPHGYCRVEYDCMAKDSSIDRGLAKHYFMKAGTGRAIPTIVRGKFVPELVKTSAFDSEKVATQNVLGLYSVQEYRRTLNWCVLYRGTANDGVRLAEMIRTACDAMPKEIYEDMVSYGGYASTMVQLIHRSMKPGKNGPVINVDDVDVEKMKKLALEGCLWLFVKEDDDLTGLAIRWGVPVDRLREWNGLSSEAEVHEGDVIRVE